MTPARLLVAPEGAWPTYAAAYIADQIRRLQEENLTRRLGVALAGGATPTPVHEALATITAASFDWQQIDLFLSDERLVSLDHPDSNYGSARRTLWDRLPEPKPRLHAVDTDRTAEEAARLYEALIRTTLSVTEGSTPVFDLVMLGLGADGHTASLFPGEPALDETRLLVAPARQPQSGQARVTFTLPLLSAARQVVFLVAGAAKAKILARVSEAAPVPEWPAALVASRATDLVWLADEAAVRLILKR